MRPLGRASRGLRLWQTRQPQIRAVYALIVILASIYLFGQIVQLTMDGDLVRIFGVSGILVAQGQVYRLLTAIFFHLGLFHLLMNLLVLHVLGSVVETLVGSLRFVILFIIAGLVGTAFSAYFNTPQVMSVGASGAIMGSLGYIIACKIAAPRSVPQAISQWAMSLLLINVAWNILSPMGLDIWGHVGGFAGGALAAGFVGLPLRTRVLERPLADLRIGGRIVVAILVFLAVLSLPMSLLTGGLSPLQALSLTADQIGLQWQRQQMAAGSVAGPWPWDRSSSVQLLQSADLPLFASAQARALSFDSDQARELQQQWQMLAADHYLLSLHLFASDYPAELTDLTETAVGFQYAYLETSAGNRIPLAEIQYYPVETETSPYYGINLLAFPRPASDAQYDWLELMVWTGRGDLSVRFDLADR